MEVVYGDEIKKPPSRGDDIETEVVGCGKSQSWEHFRQREFSNKGALFMNDHK